LSIFTVTSGSNFTERRRCFHILTSSRARSPFSDIFDIWVIFKLQFRTLFWYISLSAILQFSSWKKALKERISKFSGFPIFFESENHIIRKLRILSSNSFVSLQNYNGGSATNKPLFGHKRSLPYRGTPKWRRHYQSASCWR